MANAFSNYERRADWIAPVNTALLAKVMEYKQNKIDVNQAKMDEVISHVTSLDLAKDGDRQHLFNNLQQIQNFVNSAGGMDLSSDKTTRQVNMLIKNSIDDRVLNGYQQTKKLREEIARLQDVKKNKPDLWGAPNEDALTQAVEQYMTSDDPMAKFNGSYQNFVNVEEDMHKMAMEADKYLENVTKVTTRNGHYFIDEEKKEIPEGELKAMLMSRLSPNHLSQMQLNFNYDNKGLSKEDINKKYEKSINNKRETKKAMIAAFKNEQSKLSKDSHEFKVYETNINSLESSLNSDIDPFNFYVDSQVSDVANVYGGVRELSQTIRANPIPLRIAQFELDQKQFAFDMEYKKAKLAIDRDRAATAKRVAKAKEDEVYGTGNFSTIPEKDPGKVDVEAVNVNLNNEYRTVLDGVESKVNADRRNLSPEEFFAKYNFDKDEVTNPEKLLPIVLNGNTPMEGYTEEWKKYNAFKTKRGKYLDLAKATVDEQMPRLIELYAEKGWTVKKVEKKNGKYVPLEDEVEITALDYADAAPEQRKILKLQILGDIAREKRDYFRVEDSEQSKIIVDVINDITGEGGNFLAEDLSSRGFFGRIGAEYDKDRLRERESLAKQYEAGLLSREEYRQGVMKTRGGRFGGETATQLTSGVRLIPRSVSLMDTGQEITFKKLLNETLGADLLSGNVNNEIIVDESSVGKNDLNGLKSRVLAKAKTQGLDVDKSTFDLVGKSTSVNISLNENGGYTASILGVKGFPKVTLDANDLPTKVLQINTLEEDPELDVSYYREGQSPVVKTMSNQGLDSVTPQFAEEVLRVQEGKGAAFKAALPNIKYRIIKKGGRWVEQAIDPKGVVFKERGLQKSRLKKGALESDIDRNLIELLRY